MSRVRVWSDWRTDDGGGVSPPAACLRTALLAA